MAQGSATSADVPRKYDVVINGYGYMLLQTLEPSLPFRTHRAVYTYSPTFVERQNVSNSYGDNAQDFFLTVRQRDWSLGEQQKFFRAGQDGRYWMGSNVDVSTPGQVNLASAVTSLTFSGAVRAGARQPNGGNQDIVVADGTNAYNVSGQDGTISTIGAHGLGATPSRFAIATDGSNNFFSSSGGGSVGVRKLVGGVFSTFSATTADSLAFVNNTLYGYLASNATFFQYDSSGVATSLFQWKHGAGSAASNVAPQLTPYGGKLLITFPYAQESSEMWIYDGNGTSRLEVFPENFFVNDVEVLYGVVYVGGAFIKSAGATTIYARPAVHFFDGSEVGLLWQANTYDPFTIAFANVAIGPYTAVGISAGKVVFTDDSTGNIMAYNPASGGVSSIGTYSAGGDSCRLISTGMAILFTRDSVSAYFLPASTYPSSGYVISSLVDFDSSLPKVLRGVTVEFDAAADGNGGSVDVAYQLNGVGGSWTTLATGVTSGVETLFPANTSCHSVALKITLNKGTSTAGPVLRSMSVRGAPQQTTFRNREYILDLSGTGQKDPVRDASGSFVPLSGHEMAINLNTAITSTSPIQVSDRFANQQTCLSGSTAAAFFTAMCEPSGCEIYDTAEGWDNAQHPGGYVAKITVREV